MCVARFLVHFFSVHERDMKSFFKTLFGVKKKTHDDQTWVRSQGFNSSEIHLFICRFEQVGMKAEKFEKK